jgi:hypothetical protein
MIPDLPLLVAFFRSEEPVATAIQPLEHLTNMQNESGLGEIIDPISDAAIQCSGSPKHRSPQKYGRRYSKTFSEFCPLLWHSISKLSLLI